jgi:hypothetical protein
MGFKMKGSPAKMGTIQGTSSHASALKKKEEDIHKLIAKRTKLKEKEEKREAKREAGKKVLFGKLKTKRNIKKLEKVQAKIDVHPKALEWKEEGEKEQEPSPVTPDTPKTKEEELSPQSDTEGWGSAEKKSSGVAMKGSPTKHLVGKHPGKDGHTRADHKARRQGKKDVKLVKKGGSRNEDIKIVREGKKEGKTVENSKKVREAQNRINIKGRSKVRHTKKFWGLGKYKKKRVESWHPGIGDPQDLEKKILKGVKGTKKTKR